MLASQSDKLATAPMHASQSDDCLALPATSPQNVWATATPPEGAPVEQPAEEVWGSNADRGFDRLLQTGDSTQKIMAEVVNNSNTEPPTSTPAPNANPPTRKLSCRTALQPSDADHKLVTEMFVNQTVTGKLLKRELKERKEWVTAPDTQTLIARLAAAIRGAGPYGNAQQCTLVAVKTKRKSPQAADTNTGGNPKRRQLIKVFTPDSSGQQQPALQSVPWPQGGEQHHHQGQVLQSQLATQHYSSELDHHMQPCPWLIMFQQPSVVYQTQTGVTHLQEDPGFNQHLPTSALSAQDMSTRPQVIDQSQGHAIDQKVSEEWCLLCWFSHCICKFAHSCSSSCTNKRPCSSSTGTRRNCCSRSSGTRCSRNRSSSSSSNRRCSAPTYHITS